MADTSLGKRWEDKFKATWIKCFPNTFLFRLKDQMTGFKETSQNSCDFLALPTDKLFMIECKTHKGASIPFTAIPQYERLLDYKDLNNVHAGFLIWFSEKEIVIWVDEIEAEKMVNNGEKSIGLRMLDDNKYKIKVLKTEIKYNYPRCDFNDFVDNYEEV